MAKRGHLMTAAAGAVREQLGPAEGQYVINGMLGTNPGQPQNTGADLYRIIIDEPADACFEITWEPGPDRVMGAAIYNADCSVSVYGSDDDGSLGDCFDSPLPPGTYFIRLMNPFPDDAEASFAYTIAVNASIPFSMPLIEDETEEDWPCK